MADSQSRNIQQIDGHDGAPPPYEAIMPANSLPEWTTARDDGRVDLDVDSSLYKTLMKCVPPAKLEKHDADRESSCFDQSLDTYGHSTPHQPQPSRSDIPALNIVIQVVGSRGDVQPFIALGAELKQHGHRVRLATHDTFSEFVHASGLEFYPIGGDPAELMAYMVKNPGLIPSVKSLKSGDIQRKRRMVAEILNGCWQSCIQPDPVTKTPFVANAIIANPPSFAHIHCAQAMSIPVHLVFTMPWTNTRAFPHPLANVITENSSTDPEIMNYVSYSVVEWMTWQGLGDVINEWRTTIDLEPVTGSEGPNLPNTLQIPFTYCWSPALVPKPSDWPPHIDVCGFFFRSPPTYTSAPELKSFLEGGSPPIYIGFGSIVLEDPDKLTGMLLSAIRITGIRAIISKGWSNLGGKGDDAQFQDKNVLYIGDCPHEWLFQHVAAVVHHGGAGTTACGLLNGRPTFIVPFFGDQPFWGAMVGAAGAGPMPIPYKSLTCEYLVEAFRFCLTPEALSAAQRLAAQMKQEAGVASAVQSFYNHLPVEKLACDILPNEPAVWNYKVKRWSVKLSNVAAELLIEQSRISEANLEMYDINPIRIEPSRYDPVSGAISAAVTMSKELMHDTINIVRKPAQAYQHSRSGDGLRATADDKPASSYPQHHLTHSADATEMQVLGTKKTQDSRSCMSGVGPAAYMSVSSVGKLAGHVTRATYVDVPLAVTEGLRAVPRLYGGHVREYGYVTDWKSGFSKAGEHMVFGIADGLFDLCMEPVMGAKKEGTLGAVKGIGKGLVSITTKASSAALGLVAYPGQGIYKSIRTTNHVATSKAIRQARRDEGIYRVKNLNRPGVNRAAVTAYELFLMSTNPRVG